MAEQIRIGSMKGIRLMANIAYPKPTDACKKAERKFTPEINNRLIR